MAATQPSTDPNSALLSTHALPLKTTDFKSSKLFYKQQVLHLHCQPAKVASLLYKQRGAWIIRSHPGQIHITRISTNTARSNILAHGKLDLEL